MTSKPFRALPPGLEPPDLFVAEVASWRRESEWIVNKKIRDGVYESYLDGNRRKVVFASVVADRDRAVAKGSKLKLAGRTERFGRPDAPSASR
jgi:hypothetical protein